MDIPAFKMKGPGVSAAASVKGPSTSTDDLDDDLPSLDDLDKLQSKINAQANHVDAAQANALAERTARDVAKAGKAPLKAPGVAALIQEDRASRPPALSAVFEDGEESYEEDDEEEGGEEQGGVGGHNDDLDNGLPSLDDLDKLQTKVDAQAKIELAPAQNGVHADDAYDDVALGGDGDEDDFSNFAAFQGGSPATGPQSDKVVEQQQQGGDGDEEFVVKDLDSGTVVDVEQMNEQLAAEMQWAKQAMVQEQKVEKGKQRSMGRAAGDAAFVAEEMIRNTGSGVQFQFDQNEGFSNATVMPTGRAMNPKVGGISGGISGKIGLGGLGMGSTGSPRKDPSESNNPLERGIAHLDKGVDKMKAELDDVKQKIGDGFDAMTDGIKGIFTFKSGSKGGAL
jgi:hypothetical protein